MTVAEVRKVANGYIVMPPREYRDGVMDENVYVFQTFGALSFFLQANFEPSKPE